MPESKTAYCVKCKKQVAIVNPSLVKNTGRGGDRLTGVCGTCGTKVHRFVKKQ